HMGRWEEAHGCAAKCIGLYDVAKDAWLTHEFSEDPCVQARAFDSWCLWNLGYPDQAVQSLDPTLRLAEQIQHANSTAFALAVVPFVHAWRGDLEATLRSCEACTTYSTDNGLPFWEFLARPFGGWAMARQGKSAEGINEIRTSLRLYRQTGAEVTSTVLLVILADACRLAGRNEDALSAVEEGLRSAAERNEGFSRSELLRQKALILLDQ